MRRTRTLLGGASLLFVATNLAVWGGHVVWRSQAERELLPVRARIDTLRAQVAEDDAWVETRERLMQEYSQHEEFAARLRTRGRRAQAHAMLISTYNARMTELYRRFYLAPLPAPAPPLLDVAQDSLQ